MFAFNTVGRSNPAVVSVDPTMARRRTVTYKDDEPQYQPEYQQDMLLCEYLTKRCFYTGLHTFREGQWWAIQSDAPFPVECDIFLQSEIFCAFPEYSYPAYFCHSKFFLFANHVWSDRNKLENHGLENRKRL